MNPQQLHQELMKNIFAANMGIKNFKFNPMSKTKKYQEMIKNKLQSRFQKICRLNTQIKNQNKNYTNSELTKLANNAYAVQELSQIASNSLGPCTYKQRTMGGMSSSSYKKYLENLTTERLHKIAKSKGVKITKKKDGKTVYVKKNTVVKKLYEKKYGKH